MPVPIGPKVRKIEVNIVIQNYIIRGKISVPQNMRFSDAINRFLKDVNFIPVTDVEIKSTMQTEKIAKADFGLINKSLIVGIFPAEEGV